MTSITFPRPTKALLSLNDRTHRARKASDVRAWRAATRLAVYQAGLMNVAQDPSIVCCTFDVIGNRRRDPSNFIATIKAVVDSLVTDCGWWLDDTPEYVAVVEPELIVIGRLAQPTVTVTLVQR